MNKMKKRAVCPDCGFKIRRTKKQHEKGEHHLRGREGQFSPRVPSKRH